MNRLPALALIAAVLTLPACRDGAGEAAPDRASADVRADAAPADTAAHAAGTDDHAHGSPHGGTVKTAGDGHLELVTEHTGFKLYVLDASEGALPVADLSGAQAIIQPQGGGEAATIPLTPAGDHLHAVLPTGVMAYTAIVSVPVAGQVRSAQFEVGLDSHTQHAH